MEYLQVFNKKKEKLNEKILRKDKHNLPEGKYFMIVLIFIENSEGKFLLQKTSIKRDSCIATTGGHVTYGDDGKNTIIKEVKEELGLNLNINEIEYIDTLIYTNGILEIYYLNKDINIKSLVLQEEEVEDINWYTIKEINKFIEENKFRKTNIKPFEIILENIKNSKDQI